MLDPPVAPEAACREPVRCAQCPVHIGTQAGTRKCSLPNISAMAAVRHGPNTGLHLRQAGGNNWQQIKQAPLRRVHPKCLLSYVLIFRFCDFSRLYLRTPASVYTVYDFLVAIFVVPLPTILFGFFKIFSKFTFNIQRGRRFTPGMSLQSSHASYGCGVWGEVQTVQTDAGSEVRGEG